MAETKVRAGTAFCGWCGFPGTGWPAVRSTGEPIGGTTEAAVEAHWKSANGKAGRPLCPRNAGPGELGRAHEYRPSRSRKLEQLEPMFDNPEGAPADPGLPTPPTDPNPRKIKACAHEDDTCLLAPDQHPDADEPQVPLPAPASSEIVWLT